MDLSLFAPRTQPISAVEYLRAKLEYETTPYELKTRLAAEPGKLMVVDVRERPAFEAEHLRGAANIPAAEIVTQLASLPKERTIVTYCWDMTCALAPKAALELAQKGFKVQFLSGGIEEWKRKGFGVVKAETGPEE